MKAIVWERYGSPDVLELQEIQKPIVKDNEVLVRIRAAGANPFDWRLMRGDPYLVRMVKGLRRPRRGSIAGADMAGVVEAVGKEVTRLRPGEEVYAEIDAGGCFAEYVSVPEKLVGLKPANLTFEQAAAVPMAGVTALQALRNVGKVQPGQKVIVNGAGGGIGTFAVQIAKAFGAEVTGVCRPSKVDLVRSLGADHVIDYTKEDFTRSPERYDLLVDTVGNHSIRDFRRVLTHKGTFAIVGGGGGRLLGPAGQILKGMLISPFVSQRLAPVAGKPNGDDMDCLTELIEAGKITPIVDRVFALAEAAEAIRYLETGRVGGKVVIAI
jgi:NADPH:quinone reductase-like Zn-dependent oxidoreductase